MTTFVAAPSRVVPVAVEAERPKIYLQAGQLVAIAEPSLIVTILGSCVAICLWDARLRVGGMNHYMLPYETARQAAGPRFGNVAWSTLLERILGLGSRRQDLRAGIFGGACVMETLRDSEHVGKRNVDLADELVARERIAIVQREVGGRRGRKLAFETGSGAITVREL